MIENFGYNDFIVTGSYALIKQGIYIRDSHDIDIVILSEYNNEQKSEIKEYLKNISIFKRQKLDIIYKNDISEFDKYNYNNLIIIDGFRFLNHIEIIKAKLYSMHKKIPIGRKIKHALDITKIYEKYGEKKFICSEEDYNWLKNFLSNYSDTDIKYVISNQLLNYID